MTLNEEILNKHEQKYENSCVASSVEMVLKLEGILEPDSFEIQEHYGNKSISGDYFDGETYSRGNKSIKFHKKVFDDLGSLFDTIKNELRKKRYIVVPLITLTERNVRIYHNHIIYDFSEEGGYKTFTKLPNNPKLLDIQDMEKRFTENFNEMISKPGDQRYGIDILIYEFV